MTTFVQETQLESDQSWELIAELSKHESSSIYHLIMSHLNNDQVLVTDDEEGGYITYPLKNILDLFKKCELYKIIDKEKELVEAVKKIKNVTVRKIDKLREDRIIKSSIPEIHVAISSSKNPLSSDFKSNIIEIIIIYYILVTNCGFQNKQIDVFFDGLFSLRDALIFFQPKIYKEIYEYFKEIFLSFVKNREFPMKSFFKSFTHKLLTNSFRRKYQKAVKLYSEQEELVNEIKNYPYNLFELPWGVGVGKTAMLPSIATYYSKTKIGNFQTLYCVPMNPVRDQIAAYLYRCGIPFAFIQENSSYSGPDSQNRMNTFKYFFQPSFHCGHNVQPTVFLCNPKFVEYYLRYVKYKFDYVDMANEMEEEKEKKKMLDKMLDPSIYIPNHKPRYRHLRHNTLWKKDFVLILDEPDENDTAHLPFILDNLPITTFIMSATSCEKVLTNEIKQKYKTKYPDSNVITIPATNIGVSTTLKSMWTQQPIVLSPFHGCETKVDFVNRLFHVSHNVVWKRFLSPNVLMSWYEEIQQKKLLDLRIDFNFFTISFDAIANKVIEWGHILTSNDSLNDAFYFDNFSFQKFISSGASQKEMLSNSISKNAHLFQNGCIYGTSDIKNSYKTIKSQLFLHNKPSTSVNEEQHIINMRQNIIDKIEEEQTTTRTQIINLKKKNKSSTSKNSVQQYEDDLKDILKSKLGVIPIASKEIINTKEFFSYFHPNTKPPLLKGKPFELNEKGDLEEDPYSWFIWTDTMDKNKSNAVPEDVMLWRWKGLGSIYWSREFYIKNIKDLDSGNLSFLMADEQGAYGLNLNISHAILEENSIPAHVLFQIAGRVGRASQTNIGSVHLFTQSIFEKMFTKF